MPKDWECKDWDCKDPKGKLAGNKKRVVLILSRVHGGEQPASFIAQGTDKIVSFLNVKCDLDSHTKGSGPSSKSKSLLYGDPRLNYKLITFYTYYGSRDHWTRRERSLAGRQRNLIAIFCVQDQ